MRQDPIEAVLALRPIRARDDERDDEGHVYVLVPRFDGAILGRFLMPRLREPCFRIKLDALGASVWEACDGSLTGNEIVSRIDRMHPGEDRIRERVAIFLKRLFNQDHVRNAGSPSEPPEASRATKS
jgi:hypothetical protein